MQKNTEQIDLSRYHRQIILPQIGVKGQRHLLSSSVAIIGLGALGSIIATLLTRLGVGRIKIIDRDFIELENLHRQILYDEEDIALNLPKATAAAKKLQKMNSQVTIEPIVGEVNADSVETIISDVDLVLDGTDNFETRYLVNDACVKNSRPWIYGGVLATTGMAMVILPHRTPCFRCLIPVIPAPRTTPTTSVFGVLSTAVNVIASFEITEGLKILLRLENELIDKLIQVDVWNGSWRLIDVPRGVDACPTCAQGHYEFLDPPEKT